MTRGPSPPPVRALDSACRQLFALALHLRAADPAARSREATAALRSARAALDDLRALVDPAAAPRPGEPAPHAGPATAIPGAPVRVFVVDDHEPVRQGLRAYLATVPDVQLVGDADRRSAREQLA